MLTLSPLHNPGFLSYSGQNTEAESWGSLHLGRFKMQLNSLHIRRRSQLIFSQSIALCRVYNALQLGVLACSDSWDMNMPVIQHGPLFMQTLSSSNFQVVYLLNFRAEPNLQSKNSCLVNEILSNLTTKVFLFPVWFLGFQGIVYFLSHCFRGKVLDLGDKELKQSLLRNLPASLKWILGRAPFYILLWDVLWRNISPLIASCRLPVSTF